MNKYLLEQYIKETLKEQKKDNNKETKAATWADLRLILTADEKSDALKNISQAVLRDIFEVFNPTNSFSNTLKALGGEVNPEFMSRLKQNVASKFTALFKKNYDMNGEESVEDNPFKVDPNISLIIDDDIEKEFLKDIVKSLGNKELYPDDAFIKDSFHMTKKLQMWLEKKAKGSSVYNKQNPPIKDVPLNPWSKNKK